MLEEHKRYSPMPKQSKILLPMNSFSGSYSTMCPTKRRRQIKIEKDLGCGISTPKAGEESVQDHGEDLMMKTV